MENVFSFSTFEGQFQGRFKTNQSTFADEFKTVMKKLFTSLLTFFLIGFSFSLSAQCPGCVINGCSSTVPDGGLCDSIIPPGMANQPYDQDISFYLPNQATISGTSVTLLRVKILGLGGLPFGLDWESDKSPNDEYFPPNGENDGCVKVCGTPLVPGNYTVTVFLEGDVNTPVGQLNNQPLQYDIDVRILPDTSSGGGAFTFNYSPSGGCGTTDITFTTKFPSNGVSGYSYSWDFGNGNQSVAENPSIQNYPPGVYTVISQVTIDTAGYRLSNISIDNMTCNDCAFLVGCLGLPTERPDPFVTLHPNGSGNGASLLSPSPSYTDVQAFPLNIPITGNYTLPQLSNIAYSIKVVDDDTGNPLGGGNDDCGLAVFNGHTAGVTSINGTGGLDVSVTIDHPVLVFSDTIQIEIFPEPNPVITQSKDTTCSGDTVVLSVPSGAITYQWWKDGTLMNGSTDSTLTVRDNSAYYVEVVDSNNCFGRSDSTKVVYYAKPNTGIVVQNGVIYLNPPPSNQFNVQYFLDGVPIPGANGASFTMVDPGNYTVSVVNKDNANCAWTSGSVAFTSIDEVVFSNLEGLSLYPNPNNGQFNLDVQVKQAQDAQIVIFDMVGKNLYQKEVLLNRGENIVPVECNNLPTGVYHLSLISESEQRSLRLVIE